MKFLYLACAVLSIGLLAYAIETEVIQEVFEYTHTLSGAGLEGRFNQRGCCNEPADTYLVGGAPMVGDKSIRGCMTTTKGKPSSTKNNYKNLVCYRFTELFRNEPYEITLRAFECSSVKREGGDCQRVSIKKYRDFFIDDDKVCVTRDSKDVCLATPFSSKNCIRFYDITAPAVREVFIENREPQQVEDQQRGIIDQLLMPMPMPGGDQCNAVTVSIMVANKEKATKGLDGQCKTRYANGKSDNFQLCSIVWDSCVSVGIYEREDGTAVAAKDVKVGDKVLAMRSDKTFDYMEVYDTHEHPSAHHGDKLWNINGGEYIYTDGFRFYGEDESVLYITSDEFLSDKSEPTARILQVGDKILKYNSETKSVETVTVDSFDNIIVPDSFVYNVKVKVAEGEYQTAVASDFVSKWIPQ